MYKLQALSGHMFYKFVFHEHTLVFYVPTLIHKCIQRKLVPCADRNASNTYMYTSLKNSSHVFTPITHKVKFYQCRQGMCYTVTTNLLNIRKVLMSLRLQVRYRRSLTLQMKKRYLLFGSIQSVFTLPSHSYHLKTGC